MLDEEKGIVEDDTDAGGGDEGDVRNCIAIADIRTSAIPTDLYTPGLITGAPKAPKLSSTAEPTNWPEIKETK